MEKLCCDVLDFNVKEAAIHRSLGCLEEFHRRARFFRDGGADDVLVLGLLPQSRPEGHNA